MIKTDLFRKAGLLALLCFTGVLSMQAQQKSVAIEGVVLDSLKQPLVGATVILMHARDSLLAGFGIADSNGAFRLEVGDPDRYFLQITYVGYGTFVRELSIIDGQSDIDFGAIVLSLDGYDLSEVTVKDSFIPIIIKKDTIEYNAAAFPTPEGSVVEDLLKRLPGIEVEPDGTIKAHGETVENVLVDGKPFFDDDPKIASQNIPADLVDRVQVFDQKSDFTEFTGIDDGQEERTINLQIKDGQNKGLFGTLNAGYGPEERYKGSANVNRFTDQMQLSLLANANNINEQPFSFEDYLQFMGGFEELMNGGNVDFSQFPSNLLDNSGISDAYSGGLNFNYDFNPRTALRSNYFFNSSDNNTLSSSTLENALPEGFFVTDAENEEWTKLANHRFRAELKHQVDDSQDLKFKGNISLFNNENAFSGFSSSQSESGLLGNSSQRSSLGYLDGWSWKTDLTYRKKFSHKGRFLLLHGLVDGQQADSQSDLANINTLFPDPETNLIDSITQRQLLYSDGLSMEGGIDYVEPIGESNYLKVDASTVWIHNMRDKTFSDLLGNGQYEINEELSNQFDRNLNQNTFGTALKTVRKKWNASLGVDFQQTRLESLPLNGSPAVTGTFYSWLPNARLEYNMKPSGNLGFRYDTRIQAPSAEQLQPVVDNIDPLNIFQGNPDLRPERISSIDLNYSNFNQFYLRSVFLGVRGQFYQDRIVQASTIDDQFRRIIQPINSRNEWLMEGFYDFTTPVKGVDLKFGFNGSLRYQHSNFLVNDALDLFDIWEFDHTVRLQNKVKEMWDVGVGYKVHLTKTAFDVNEALDLPFLDQTAFTDLYWYSKKGSWALNANLKYQVYSEARARPGQAFVYLDAGVRKSFFKKQFSLYIKGTNLLDEEVIFQRESYGNQLQETLKNRFGRVILFGAIYKIRAFGK
ncbi:MAG: TonB-dependent receptor [Saprospiraceae bacterium]|nr:TonB-dependent receptor [Saprospiraceae bacterium]